MFYVVGWLLVMDFCHLIAMGSPASAMWGRHRRPAYC